MRRRGDGTRTAGTARAPHKHFGHEAKILPQGGFTPPEDVKSKGVPAQAWIARGDRGMIVK